ncbi:MAG TPA: lytic transglycosylase domain-containing protein [Symbiobacteriaceae bacterium]
MRSCFRLHRRWWAAVAAGAVAAPALLGGVAAAPSDVGQDLLPPPDVNPLEVLPPDPAEIKARLLCWGIDRIADIVPAEYQQMVLDTAARHRIDPRLLAAVVTVETKWNPTIVGRAGEKGLMQILPATGTWLARKAGLEEYDLADPATNLHLGAFYLAMLLEQHGTVEKALAAYNGGPRAVKSWQSNLYVRKVLNVYRQAAPYGAIRPVAAAS